VLRVGDGDGKCRFFTSDLTAEYIHINADYHT
jgi:N-acetylglutamate synthase/N-acetylornithine aminotransferase